GGTSASGNPWPDGLQVGLGVSTGAISKDFSQGSLQATGAPLDMAIWGDGFFQIQLPTGETAYTRAGSFTKDNNGDMVMHGTGYYMVPNINIPGDGSITIGADGTVSQQQPDGTSAE